MRPSDWRVGLLAALLIVLAVLLSMRVFSAGDNGFDLRGSLVPAEEIHLGGPSRDGIPALDRPRFLAASQADFLDGEDRVLGLVRNGEAKAYPIPIMNWHEIVNDVVGGEQIAVTYCPLCGTGVAFSSSVDGRSLNFGVSGLLFNSDVLLYDRETESLWSQLLKKAVTGPLKGRALQALPLTHTTWRAWRREHPGTRVLSTDTGHRRDYHRDPYGGYAQERGLYFPVSAQSRRYHPKELVLGMEIGGRFKAYPFAELSRSAKREIRDNFNGRELRVEFDRVNASARAYDAAGKQLPAVTGFWFAWYAFHPDTAVFTAE
jgi:hypothetical protein